MKLVKASSGKQLWAPTPTPRSETYIIDFESFTAFECACCLSDSLSDSYSHYRPISDDVKNPDLSSSTAAPAKD